MCRRILWPPSTACSAANILGLMLVRCNQHTQAGTVTVKGTGGDNEREFLRRAAVLGIRVSPYFAAGGGASSDED